MDFILSREEFLLESAMQENNSQKLKQECIDAARWFLTEGYKAYLQEKEANFEKDKEVTTIPFCTNPFASLKEFKDIDSDVLDPKKYEEGELVIGWNVLDEETGEQTPAAEFNFGKVLSISIKESNNDESISSNLPFYDTSSYHVKFRYSIKDSNVELNTNSKNGLDKFFFFEFEPTKRDNVFIGKKSGNDFTIKFLPKYLPLKDSLSKIQKELAKAKLAQRFLYIEYSREDHYIIVGMAAKKKGRHEAYHHKGQKKGEEDFILKHVMDIKNKTDKFYINKMQNDRKIVKYFDYDGKARDKYGNIIGERDTCEGFKINQDNGISDEDAIAMLIDWIDDDVKGKETSRIVYKPRNNGQKECIDRLQAFKNSDDEKLLINAVPRFGKTATVLAGLITDNSQFKANKILILTSKPTDARESWAQEIRKFDFGRDYINYDINEIETSSDLKSDKFTLFMSLQSLGEKGKLKESVIFEDENTLSNEEKKEVNTEVREFKRNQRKIEGFDFDVLVIDECHFGVDTRITKSILDKINYKKKVEISGTPFRKIQSGQYTKDQIFSYTILDDYKENKDKKDYVRLNIVSYDTDTMKNKKAMHGSYDKAHREDFEKLVELFDSDSFSFDAFFKNGDQKQINLFVDSMLNPKFNKFMREHYISNIMVCVSQVEFAKKINNFLDSIEGTAWVDHYMLTGDMTDKTLTQMNEKLKTNKMKGIPTILLTCARWCTGVTLDYLDAFCWCTNCNSAERFLQYSMRTCSKWSDDLSANAAINGRLKNGTYKKDGWVFCFQNGQAIDVRNQVIKYMNSIGTKASGNSSEIREYAEVLPVWKVYETGNGQFDFKEMGEEDTVHAYDDYMVNKLGDKDYSEFFKADFDFDEFDIDYTDENVASLKKELFAADDRIKKPVMNRTEWEADNAAKKSDEEKDKRITSFVKFLSAIKKIPYLMFDENIELDTKDSKSFVDLFDNNDAKMLTGIDKDVANDIIDSGVIRDKSSLFQQFNLVKRSLDSKSSEGEDVWNNFAEKHLKTGIDGRTGKKEKYTYADVIPQMYENEKLDGKKVIIISNGKISSVHKDIEKKAKDVTHLVIFDRDNPANKFICDREAKALGLKGPVDFIEGEDGCDKRIEEYMKNKAHIAESSGDKKAFDVCIMNPPYDRNLHLKILEKVIPYAEETINISPIRWLQDPLAKYKKNSDYNKFKESVAEHIANLTVVNAKDSQALFNIAHTNLGILKLNDRGGYNLNKDRNKLVDKLIEKLRNEEKILSNDERNGKYMIYFPEIHGHVGAYDWTEMTSKRYDIALKVEKSYKHPGVGFETEIERKNFYNALFTTFFKYLISELRSNQKTIETLKFLPFMSDYTHPWDNKRFCDYFNITGYISDTEAEPGSEWEEILKTMEKYK